MRAGLSDDNGWGRATKALATASDRELVALARSGAEGAFEAIVARYRSPLLRYCARRVGADHAEDIVQHTLLQASLRLRTDPRPLELKAWLYQVARNAAINLRSRRDFSHEELDPNYDGVPQPPAVLEQRLRLRETTAAVAALPERQREALVLSAVEGLEYAEIASRLQTTETSVRGLIERARRSLRDAVPFVLPLPWLRSLWRSIATNPAVVAPEIAAPAAAAQTAAAVVVATATVAGSFAAEPPARAAAAQRPEPLVARAATAAERARPLANLRLVAPAPVSRPAPRATPAAPPALQPPEPAAPVRAREQKPAPGQKPPAAPPAEQPVEEEPEKEPVPEEEPPAEEPQTEEPVPEEPPADEYTEEEPPAEEEPLPDGEELPPPEEEQPDALRDVPIEPEKVEEPTPETPEP